MWEWQFAETFNINPLDLRRISVGQFYKGIQHLKKRERGTTWPPA